MTVGEKNCFWQRNVQFWRVHSCVDGQCPRGGFLLDMLLLLSSDEKGQNEDSQSVGYGER